MCTQQLIWCRCGHGEFLPIELCTQAQRAGYCWTVVWGDHRVVVELPCSYCRLGFNLRRPLGTARPEVSAKMGEGGENKERDKGEKREGEREGVVDPVLSVAEEGGVGGAKDDGLAEEVGFPPTPPPEWADVLGTEFGERFDLSQELWQYS